LKIMTSMETRIADLNAEFLGVPHLLLMENAGRSVADAVSKRMNVEGKRVAVFCGLGDNGGDGLVAARHLASLGAKVTVILVGDEENIRTDEAKLNWNAVKAMFTVEKIVVRDSSDVKKLEGELSKMDVIVDALLGTGVRGEVREPIASVIDLINRIKGFKVSVDVPSGINPDTGEVGGRAVKADVTVCLHSLKPALSTSPFTGELEVYPIGIPPEAEIIVGPGDLEAAKITRRAESYKGEHGRVLVVGGGINYSGAPALTALAALATGVDIVIVAAPSSVANVIRSYSPNLIVNPLPGETYSPESVEKVESIMKRVTALAIGPGLGLEDETFNAVIETLELARKSRIPTVVDADALKAIAKKPDSVADGNMVLTPHQGEFLAITGEKLPGKSLREKMELVKEWSKRLRATILLKAHWDVISNGEKVKVNITGNPGMTVGGTGDVLTGCCAAILSWGKDAFTAAAAAAFINGRAGDLAVQQKGYHITATDVINHIPQAMGDTEKQAKHVTM